MVPSSQAGRGTAVEFQVWAYRVLHHHARVFVVQDVAVRDDARGERVGGEADVAIQRVHQPDAGGGAVEHADDRLGNRRIERVAGLPVGAAVQWTMGRQPCAHSGRGPAQLIIGDVY